MSRHAVIRTMHRATASVAFHYYIIMIYTVIYFVAAWLTYFLDFSLPSNSCIGPFWCSALVNLKRIHGLVLGWERERKKRKDKLASGTWNGKHFLTLHTIKPQPYIIHHYTTHVPRKGVRTVRMLVESRTAILYLITLNGRTTHRLYNVSLYVQG